ncbi:MAG TPA: biopolymer transporter ExbD [Allosphingosinicella sp.]|jgi:biopolymer transport protein ExbD
MTRRRSLPSFALPAQAPIVDLNTTPLIDVMLVLLIMFIITVPVANHEVPLDLPQGDFKGAEPVVHKLVIDPPGRSYLDGKAIAREDLGARLAAVRADPNSLLHMSADPQTRYEDFDHVLAIIKRAGITRMGMVGNEGYVAALN